VDMDNYGAVGGITAYAVGTDACNLGDIPVSWYQSTPAHPVIAQNMFRLKDGRFEQIGQSWLKHTFESLNSGFCGNCIQPPDGGAQLGVSCSDVYGSGYNGSQGNGPRSQVNGTTGVFPYPFNAPPAAPTIGRRLQVFTNDIDPAQNAGALYFAEAHYLTADDAQYTHGGFVATNGLNNATYRRITIASPTAVPQFATASVARVPPVQAWQDSDAAVQIADADYTDLSLGAPGITARFVVGCRVTSLGGGMYHYEYAVYNHNADRAGGAFSVPVAAGVMVSNIGFHGVFAHSGEPYPNTAANPDGWVGTVSGGQLAWRPTETYVSPGNNGNAIRWGTMYNFRFDANVAPVAGVAMVGLWKPGTPSSVAVAASVPGTPPCRVDFNGDGAVNVQDFLAFLSAYAGADARCDFNADGAVNVADFLAFLAGYAGGC
jgi:hypothetical protein